MYCDIRCVVLQRAKRKMSGGQQQLTSPDSKMTTIFLHMRPNERLIPVSFPNSPPPTASELVQRCTLRLQLPADDELVGFLSENDGATKHVMLAPTVMSRLWGEWSRQPAVKFLAITKLGPVFFLVLTTA